MMSEARAQGPFTETSDPAVRLFDDAHLFPHWAHRATVAARKPHDGGRGLGQRRA
jgi:hypothetical protein